MSNSPSSRQHQQQQQQSGGGATGTIYGVSSMPQAQQVHQPGVLAETYTVQPYPPAGTYAAPALPGYGITHYHAAGYPPAVAYPYAHHPAHGAYTAAAHFYPPPHLPQGGVSGGPLPNPYVGYPYAIYASSAPVRSPTSAQMMGDNVLVSSSTSENVGVSDYDQYANKNSSSPLKHDAAVNITGARPASYVAKKNVEDVIKKGVTDRSPPNPSTATTRSNPITRAKPMHLHVDTQLPDLKGPVTESHYNADDMVSKVKPMRSDFHFYAQDHKNHILHTLESEMDVSDPVELMSELNERLLKRWEDETTKVRSLYMAKEEEDRTRFMNEEEIESRHCATMTSRPKSLGSAHSDRDSNKSTPRNNEDDDDDGEHEGDNDDHDNGNHDEDGNVSNDRNNDKDDDEDDYESPNKKLKENDKKGNGQAVSGGQNVQNNKQ